MDKAVVLVLLVSLGILQSFGMVVVPRPRSRCPEPPISKREEMANIIVTGFINKVMRKPRSTMYDAEVQIVNVFKGEDILENAVVPQMANNKIKVSGFGASNICENAVHRGDTRILMMNSNSHGHLMLNSSVVRITFNNLEVAEAAVKDVQAITKAPLIKGACEPVLCTFGAKCQETEDGGAKCVCPDYCPSVFAPVCGTDYVTYQSECHLKVASCEDKRLLTVEYEAACADPCEDHRCDLGADCIADGRIPKCVCKESCAEIYEPVCASNGKDYGNECLLLQDSCRNKVNLTVIYHGFCDPCNGVEYEDGSVCKLDANRTATPHCPNNCIEAPDSSVCASNGQIYSSQCDMERQGCINELDLMVLPDEACTEGPCASSPCEYGICMVNKDLNVSCVCNEMCEDVFHPVCGSDGKTYDNECEMRKASCLNEEEIQFIAKDFCENVMDMCQNFRCDYGASCVTKNGLPVCVCNMDCSMSATSPVCGSGWVTFPNPCELSLASCQQKRDIDIIGMGECEGCKMDTCPFGGMCSITSEGPMCSCADGCVAVYAPICGSDGKTYSNQCEMIKERCFLQQDITVVSKGTCDQCKDVVCQAGAECNKGICKCQNKCTRNFDPVCGSDFVTYDNECMLTAAMCRDNTTLEIVYFGECDEYISGSGSGSGTDIDTIDMEMDFTTLMPIITHCDESTCSFGGECVTREDGNMECACNMACPAIFSPVCGSDRVTYGNDCHLKMAQCVQQMAIEQLAECDEVEMLACDGDAPLFNNSTMKEYTCTVENRGEECPSGSYCHIDPMGQFAVCCAEEMVTSEPTMCHESEFGCCSDEVTAALEDFSNCLDDSCGCNELGAYSDGCDMDGQCSCKPGVGGLTCNRCTPGFWNFKGIADGNAGCQPCGCNKGGASRDDCEQDMGRCLCKPGVSGIKCDMCPFGEVMGAMGCEPDETYEPIPCGELTCNFSAECHEVNGVSKCMCPENCPGHSEQVCGTDGKTYANECQMRIVACRSMKEIYMQSMGACETTVDIPTTPPEGGCEMTIYGCCPDGVTTAMDIERAGCQGVTTSVLPVMETTIEPSTPEMTVQACSSSPCQKGGTCMESDELPGFMCSCPLGYGGPVCMDVVHFTTPSFMGDSYITFSSARAFFSVDIILEFQTEQSNGLLFFNGNDENGNGDFIALVLVDDHVEFRFDLGAPAGVIMRSTVPIQKYQWYKVHASRDKRDGWISVNGEARVTGSSVGGSKGLSLTQDMFIGGILEGKDRVFMRTNATNGLDGCIRYLSVNDKEYDMVYPGTSEEILYGANVGNCGEDPCLVNPCKNNGTCEPTNAENYRCDCMDSFVGPLCGDIFVDQCEGNMCHNGSTCQPEPEGGYRCDCPVGMTGERCEEDMEPKIAGKFIPAFSGNSYLEYARLNINGKNEIKVEFRTSNLNGMIFYNGQNTDGTGDFISLNLVDGYLDYRYELGSGPAEIRSNERVPLGEWITVMLVRDVRDGYMIISGQDKIMGTSKEIKESDLNEGSLSQLNLKENLFLGGSKDYSQLARKAAITDGLTGAIRKFSFNGVEIADFEGDALNNVNIEQYIPDICFPFPCLHGFLCSPNEDETDYDCVCPEGLVALMNMCVSGEATMSMAITTAEVEVEMGITTEMDAMDEAKSSMRPEMMKTKMMMMMTETKMEEGEGDGKVITHQPAMTEVMTELETITEVVEGHKTDMVRPISSMKPDKVTDAMMYMTDEEGEEIGTEIEEEMGTSMTDKPQMTPDTMVTEEKDLMEPEMEKTTPKTEMVTSMLKVPSSKMPEEKEPMFPSSMMPPPPPITTIVPRVKTTMMPKMSTTKPPPTRTMAPPSTMAATTKMATTTMVPPTTKAATTKMATTTMAPPTTMATTTTMGTTTTMATTTAATTMPAINYDAPVSFSGSTFYTYQNMISRKNKGQFHNEFELIFKTSEENGLLIWNGPMDFIGLAVVDGYVCFTYQLGSGTLKMESSIYVADDNFHRIYVSRYLRAGTLRVDDEEPVLAESKPGASQLNTDGELHVGGAVNVPAGKFQSGFYSNFVGCIGNIRVEGQPLHLYDDAIETQPTDFCSLPPA